MDGIDEPYCFVVDNYTENLEDIRHIRVREVLDDGFLGILPQNQHVACRPYHTYQVLHDLHDTAVDRLNEKRTKVVSTLLTSTRTFHTVNNKTDLSYKPEDSHFVPRLRMTERLRVSSNEHVEADKTSESIHPP